MTETELLTAINTRIERSREYIEEKIAKERAAAYDLYYGRPLGDEVKGRSQVQSRDVATGVDSALPALIKIFAGSDKTVEAVARGPEDVDVAEQATELCNYVFQTQNNGYLLLHNGIKDGLLVKTGAYKWYWDDTPEIKEETLMGLSDGDMQILSQDPQVEIVAHSEVPVMGQTMHSVTIRRSKKAGKVRIVVIPPEELLIDPESFSPLAEDHPFIAHAPLKTLSELVSMGYDKDEILELAPEGDDDAFDETEIARYLRTNALSLSRDMTDDEADVSRRKWRYYECYVLMDYDGDGISERRKICKIANTILHNEATDHVPISYWTPKIMPHEPIGMSMGDDLADMQILSTVLTRQTLDNIYQANAPRLGVIDGQVTMEDLMPWRVGGPIRMKSKDAIFPVVTPFMADKTFGMLEWVKQESEGRTGVTRWISGLETKGLNDTATAANIQANNSNARIEMYARNFAETALKQVFKGILYLLAKHQQEPLTLRLRNKYIPIDPRAWTTEYDFTINVGLGTGSKDQMAMHLSNMIGLQLQLAQSPYAMLVPPDQIYNSAAKLANTTGFKDPEQFFRDPSKPPEVDPQTGQPLQQPWPPDPGPPPEIQKAQMQIEADKQKEGAKQQAEAQKAAMDQQAEQQKMAQEAALQQQEAAREAQLRERELQMEAMFREKELAMEYAFKEKEAVLDAKIELFTAQLQAGIQAKQANDSAMAEQQRVQNEGKQVESESKRSEADSGALAAAIQGMTAAISKLNGPKTIKNNGDGSYTAQ